MKKFVLHSENNITDIQSYKDHFGDYLNLQKIANSFFEDLKEYTLFKRDITQSSIYQLLTDGNIKEDFILINAASFDYLVFKDKFLLKNNPHLILDGSVLIANILNIKRIDIILKDYYLEERDIILKAIVEAEDSNFVNDIEINIYDEYAYYNKYNIRLTPSFLENKKYVFDLETVSQIAYLAHIGGFTFKNYGNGDYKGSFIVSVTGDIISPNLYEFEMHTPLKNILKASGGTVKEYSIKCVFTNGFLNPPIDFDTFQKMTLDYECFGSYNMKLGNGGLCFIQEDRCMIRVAVKIIQFAKSVSCRKCSPCHYGFDLCEYYINRMLLGYSSFDDYSNLKSAAEMIKIGASCLYIRSIADCILAVMEMFKDEFIYLIENKITLYSFVKS
ncbi:NADH-ubiquinone oxidoreductase-F iron-sulfur binding region domain-containing protein [Brachyspira hampsonii]|uniref:NADH-ubiquinone oxidoreductase-F iron-sulfur binding region domain-containing protein n=1 Tax=Brachyspira hampsonii TaxID=1287055 RepID=UPI001CA572E5|nr:NADH-ubiquinone oxidoreductase-F iron-sulfur binding region domain-containing protein [Brachyspira hampsonii]MBW5389162.1 NADH-quinone oxidoreductase subunit F [Brachyspira hampsonii]